MSILIVDDDFGIRELLTHILEDEGYAVAWAENGKAALEYLRQRTDLPCLILLDLMMPVMAGAEFRRIQLRDPALAPIPVVVISAAYGDHLASTLPGAVGYLQKPIDFTELMQIVRRYCEEDK